MSPRRPSTGAHRKRSLNGHEAAAFRAPDHGIRLVAEPVCDLPLSHAEAEKSASDIAESAAIAAALAARDWLLEPALQCEEMIQSAAASALSITGADGAAIALQSGTTVVCRISLGIAPPVGVTVMSGTGISGLCLQSGTTEVCSDTWADPRLASAATDAVRSVIAAPIRKESGVAGIVEVFSISPSAFGAVDVRTVELLADALAHRYTPPTTSVGEPTPGQSPEEAAEAALLHSASASTADEAAVPFGTAVNRSQFDSIRVKTFLAFLLIGSIGFTAAAAYRYLRHSGQISSSAKVTSLAVLPETVAASAAGAASTEITAVHYDSHPQFTAISLNLSGQVAYSARRLEHPDRIYFDFAAAGGAPRVPQSLDLHDARIRRIRIGTPAPGKTRVVLDLNCACQFSAAMSALPPYKLSVVVQ